MVLPAVHIRTDLFHLVEVETDDLILQVEHGMVQETVKEQALYNFDTTICYDKPLQEMYEWMDAADEPEPEPLPEPELPPEPEPPPEFPPELPPELLC